MQEKRSRSRRDVHWDQMVEGNPDKARTEEADKRKGLSWAGMLALVLLAIAVATGFAYLLVYPYFQEHPR